MNDGMNVFFEVHRNLPREAPGDDIFTRQAFESLPPLDDHPAILDIGCGPGVQTLVLAQLSSGDITATIPMLRFSIASVNALGMLEWAIASIPSALVAMLFPDATFDLIWSKGAIYVIGVEAGWQQWWQYLKPVGYLVFRELLWLHPNSPAPVRDFWQSAYSAMQTVDEVGDRCQSQRD